MWQERTIDPATALSRVSDETIEFSLHANPFDHWWHTGLPSNVVALLGRRAAVARLNARWGLVERKDRPTHAPIGQHA